MDPKMDSGCAAAEAEVEPFYDVSRLLLPEEVLGIIDQLLCHEVSSEMRAPCRVSSAHVLSDVMAFRISPLSNSLHELLRRGPLYAGSS